MTAAVSSKRNARGEWRPQEPISLAPINAWPPRPAATFKWLFGFPGYLWPQNAFWLGSTLIPGFFSRPTITAYEALTYWAFANGYLGFFDIGADQTLFWTWLALLLLVAPVIHAVHFYFAHRLLHTRLLYKPVHSVHHRNVEVGPWSGLAMHPVEHILYFSSRSRQRTDRHQRNLRSLSIACSWATASASSALALA